jgi:response regulator RpfG family c-di-GMP phosphodiesterase
MIARPHETVLPCCLVVDDEPRLRQAMVHLMRADGFQCIEAANGVEALDQLGRHPVSLMLSDLRMPKMGGLELLRESRKLYPDLAVVMITAVADVEVAMNCLTGGAADYVVKPYQLEDVRARVAQALDKRRLLLENRAYRESLEDRVREQARENEELFLASIQSLAEALELKDPYTRGHSIRVSKYASTIARALGLYGDMLRQIELGGHVHDIGKIGVRETVLNKAERLTADEYEHIMTHPVLGWRILAPLLADRPSALNIVRSHHERYDGLGTPDGLTGAAIPLEARIVAVADALDAMTSDRPYRPSEMSLCEALDEIRRNALTQFDPRVVEALTHAVASGDLQLLPKSSQAGPLMPAV